MKLLSYAAIRPGFQALGSISVRLGTNSIFSHTEIAFEPGDGVDDLLPDGTSAIGEDGSVWCASATAAERIPETSTRRPGRYGGVRFKRIVVGDHWLVQDITGLFDARRAAKTFIEHEGQAYDWRGIVGFAGPVLNLMVNHSERKFTCTEICASALGFPDSHRFHPGNFPPVIARIAETPSGESSIVDYALELHRLRNAQRK